MKNEMKTFKNGRRSEILLNNIYSKTSSIVMFSVIVLVLGDVFSHSPGFGYLMIKF